MIRILTATLLLLVSGCAGAVPPSPAASASDLQQRCERAGHWWRSDIAGGYCERT